METPLVTVVCLCFNHQHFVKEAIDSVLQQTYQPVQLIVVDDASSDKSVEVIHQVLSDHPEIIFLALPENLGNCRAFNKGFAFAKGEYIIDLAADDVLLPDRISKGVAALTASGPHFGVHFSDAELIDEEGKSIGVHSARFPHDTIPQGDIYLPLITRYFINSPSMMIRRSVLEKLGGYDESLAYEDFDFLIRSSRVFKYCYSPEALIQRRIVDNSMSRNQYRRGSLQMISTLKVCEKIFHLNRNDEERKALSRRIRYEMKKALQLNSWGLAFNYLQLLIKNRS